MHAHPRKLSLSTSEIEGRLYAVVSVNAFEDIERSLLKSAPVSFEGETQEARLARRKRNWIARVRYVEISARS